MREAVTTAFIWSFIFFVILFSLAGSGPLALGGREEGSRGTWREGPRSRTRISGSLLLDQYDRTLCLC